MLFGKKKANEKLLGVILEACEANADAYGEECYRLMKGAENLPDAEADAIINEAATNARSQYFFNVEKTVINKYKNDPAVVSRITYIRNHPSEMGWAYSDIDPKQPAGAGTLYLICYFAIIGGIAAPSVCIVLNHKQNDIMNEALRRIAIKYDIH
ncbi:MAG: hypothetical protein IKZ44_09260 [Clostridia bacterium]|nr:hypothetical protein [Clostridia bacterium]